MEEKTCCVTGHRDIPDEQIDAVKYALRREIVKAVSDGYTGFMTGFANGADQYFAEIVVILQKDFPELRLIAVLPYRKRMDSLCQKEHTNALLDACAEVIVIQDEYRPNVYAKRMRIVEPLGYDCIADKGTPIEFIALPEVIDDINAWNGDGLHYYE